MVVVVVPGGGRGEAVVVGWVVLLLLLLGAAGRGRGLLGWYPLGMGLGGGCLGPRGLVDARLGWVMACRCCCWVPDLGRGVAGGRGGVALWSRCGGSRRVARL